MKYLSLIIPLSILYFFVFIIRSNSKNKKLHGKELFAVYLPLKNSFLYIFFAFVFSLFIAVSSFSKFHLNDYIIMFTIFFTLICLCIYLILKDILKEIIVVGSIIYRKKFGKAEEIDVHDIANVKSTNYGINIYFKNNKMLEVQSRYNGYFDLCDYIKAHNIPIEDWHMRTNVR